MNQVSKREESWRDKLENTLLQLENWTKHFVALETNMSTWHLARLKAGNEAAEEAVFRLQGVLCALDLPPVIQPIR